MVKDLVVKFGGTSVANQTKKLIEIVTTEEPRYVVVSAPGKKNSSDTKVTDLLDKLDKTENSNLINAIIERYQGIGDDSRLPSIQVELVSRILKFKSQVRTEEIMAFGEWASGKILEPVLGIPFYDPKLFIQINPDKNFSKVFDKKSIPNRAIIPGFYGSTIEGEIMTFLRGGSDLTGAILSHHFKLPYHNYTDSGIKPVDPRYVENCDKLILEMTYRELRDLTLSGFSIIQEDVWKFMEKARVPLIVRGTEEYPKPGTLVVNERLLRDSKRPITGISYQENFVVINVDSENVQNRGFDRSLHDVFFKNEVNITTTSGGLTDTSFLVKRKELTTTKLNNILAEFVNLEYGYSLRDNLACLVIAGEELRENRGILGKISSIISSSGNNIDFVSQSGSERSIIYAVRGGELGVRSLKALYKSFFSK